MASGRRRLSRKRGSKIAVVCAGGGVTGAVYEIGCLRALDELIDRSVNELDLYVGISGGAFVASLLAAGVPPRELYEQATTPARTPFGIRSYCDDRKAADLGARGWVRKPFDYRALVAACAGILGPKE